MTEFITGWVKFWALEPRRKMPDPDWETQNDFLKRYFGPRSEASIEFVLRRKQGRTVILSEEILVDEDPEVSEL